MRLERESGILLHPTSLPGGQGVGDLGPEAYAFIGFLVEAGQRVWQVLPLGPAGYGDSPYQCFSVFAGNPLLVSLELLAREGWLERAAWEGVEFVEGRASYEAAAAFKLPLLGRAAAAFEERATAGQRAEYEAFCEGAAYWLEDYALFMAAKRRYHDVPWYEWDAALRAREPAALARLGAEEAGPIREVKFTQWCFFRQWAALREVCRARGIRLMGDLPLYAAADSAEVWRARGLWQLTETGAPAVEAGVPADCFSASGQAWGYPAYRWEAMEAEGFGWWVERFRAALGLYDRVRVSHFRGLAAGWQTPPGEWVEGPGARLLAAVEAKLGRLPVVAENLGVITPEVAAIRREFGYPGMAVLEFAFGDDPQAPDFRPHNYVRELVAYTGTHDNNTAMGWWASDRAGEPARTEEELRRERERTLAYLGTERADELHWKLIRLLMGSVADTVVIPAQDVLGLGSEGRMNRPGKAGGNWQWRLERGALTVGMAERLKELAITYER